MTTTTETIRDFVTGDFRTAAVFDKYGLDFCCGGGLPLEDACRKKGIDLDAIRRDLAEITAAPSCGVDDPARWDTGRLIDHIVTKHHAYVRSTLPTIVKHARKVAGVYGAAMPEMVAIADLVELVGTEMASHMDREEMILFPHIRRLAEASAHGYLPPAAPFGSVSSPIAMMEVEHQAAGDEMASIRRLAREYTPPAEACTTFRVLYEELAQFEADLHRHVHLENNILFPRARALEHIEG
ncbi:MAG TPA: iron-sulfur cluster repair di-iron protein [Candidatus Eisenbacteria bacterium]